MRYLVGIMGLLLVGCATAEYGKLITPDEVTWIEKGKTTRGEVLARFGEPFSEVPDLATSTYETETTTTRSEEGKTQKSVTVTKRKPTGSIAKYFHTKSEGVAFSIKTTSESFWIRYDEHGIVQDFGFASRPGLSVR